ncbi:MAG: hypothetical protein JRF33_24265 [Deltaproteobacteria bacterium]|nr:hypothetical protein [Deltaproteobacteria bacterium]
MKRKIIPAILVVLLLLSGCGDGFPIGDRDLRIIEVDGWMGSQFFSRGGERLITIHRTLKRNTITRELSLERDTIGVYQLENSEKIYEYKSEHRIWRAYTCADPDIIIYGEDNFPEDNDLELVFRSISSGEEIARFWVRNLPDAWNDTDFHCDMEENRIYFNQGYCSIAIADGSTGEILQTIEHECITGLSPLFVQKASDRIIRLDRTSHIFYIFSLSTGELLGTFDEWPNPYDLSYMCQAWELDQSHLLFAINDKKDDVTGIYFQVLNLDDFSIESESVIENCSYPGSLALAADGTHVVGFFGARDGCLGGENWPSITAFNFVDGAVTSRIDASQHGQGPFVPLTEIGLIYLEDWLTVPSATFYSYPDLEIVHQAKAPIDAEEHFYISDGNLLVMESYFSDQFAVYDLNNFRTLDRFHLCDNVGANTLAVSPNQKWAAVICDGIEDDDDDGNIGPPPEGAGVAIVGLDGYR